MSSALAGRVATALARPVEGPVRDFADRLALAQTAHGPAALAVLFYGSNLRTGSLDGVLDFYVLTDGPGERGIWPRVSYHEWPHVGTTLRAKVATMSLATFAEAAAGELVDTTIWARFVQPGALAWHRDTPAREATVEAVAAAARTAARLAATLGTPGATEEDFWRALFRATYRAEFRVEKAGRESSILEANRAHFDGLLPVALAAQGIDFAQGPQGTLSPALTPQQRARTLRWWRRRRRLGKPLNLVRLVRASTTFEGAAKYAAWKIERHTGVAIPVTPWRERHPLLAAPGVMWQVWRSRAGA